MAEKRGGLLQLEEDYKNNSRWGHRVCIVPEEGEKLDEKYLFPNGIYTIHNITPDGRGYHFNYNLIRTILKKR